jgi:dihydrofolate reductase
MSPELVLVAAIDECGAIGLGNQLPWRLPDDLKRFKALTLGQAVLMGRKTAESLGRALPGRRNLVLTRSGRAPFGDMEVVPSLASARAACDGASLMVIGGGEVYALALPLATRLHLTHVHTRVEGADAFFPAFDAAGWTVERREAHEADARHAHAFDFVDYRRASAGADQGSVAASS